MWGIDTFIMRGSRLRRSRCGEGGRSWVYVVMRYEGMMGNVYIAGVNCGSLCWVKLGRSMTAYPELITAHPFAIYPYLWYP